MKYRYFLLLSIIVFAISSCRKPDQFPDEPVISFKSISTTQNTLGYDTKLNVKLNFTDGDGDVGYRQVGLNDPIFDNPNSQYYDNYIANYFHFVNGSWVYFPTVDSLPLGGRIPYLTPVGKNKALQGEISCDIDVPPNSVNDTFRLELFIYDRALHKSNVVTTSAIILNTQ